MISTSDMAWMAGILDLKGRLLYKKNSTRRPGNRQITLAVETRMEIIVRRLAALTGTNPEFKGSKPLSEMFRRGCNEHCPDQHVHVGDGLSMPASGRWTISGPGAAMVLENLRPFLSTTEMYEEVIDEIRQSATLAGRGSSAVFGSLSRLKGLGWVLSEPFASALDGKTVAIEPPDLEDEIEVEEPLDEAA